MISRRICYFFLQNQSVFNKQTEPEESSWLIRRPVVFREAYLYSLEGEPRKGGRLNSLLSFWETFSAGCHEAGTSPLPPPVQSWAPGPLAVSRRAAAQTSPLPPVSPFLQKGSGHGAVLSCWKHPPSTRVPRAEGWRQQKQQALSFPSPSRKRIIKRSIAEENCRRGGFHMNFFLCSVLIKWLRDCVKWWIFLLFSRRRFSWVGLCSNSAQRSWFFLVPAFFFFCSGASQNEKPR